MNLVRAELERLSARRFVQLMVVLLVLAFGVTAATTLAGSHKPSADELASARAQATEARRGMEMAFQECLARQNGTLPPREPESYYPRDCSEIDPVRSERLPITADYLPGVFSFAEQARPLLYFLIAFLVLFGFLVGASYIGADLNSGGVVNLLLWRPRRLTVLGAKLGALLGSVLALSVLASLFYLATFWVIGQTAGLAGRLSGDFWRSLGAVHGRGMVLVLLASALGFAIATLGRHTSAALGAVAAYAVVWELGARLVLEIVDARRPDQLMLSSHIGAWLTGETRFWDSQLCADSRPGVYCESFYSLTWGPALLVLLVITGGLTAAAFVVFRRRDLI
ncbi:ABC transporter permease subunit [Micromonospora sp. STR1_7]|uniref:ABC transporter permease subunit n=1 Tax=Micromonospora parastrephiae TaxID=2806101 RepID=A0ABS1XY56_9ACTN|nr:ABC transporter permease subunit [Micromonospora parastrephiae]MBM0234195.1 ABC transporter permease subunit [Micromonospora parastrephiae]